VCGKYNVLCSMYWNHMSGDVGPGVHAISKTYSQSTCPFLFFIIIIIHAPLYAIHTHICLIALSMVKVNHM
jgi:hypothetical protein